MTAVDFARLWQRYQTLRRQAEASRELALWDKVSDVERRLDHSAAIVLEQEQEKEHG